MRRGNRKIEMKIIRQVLVTGGAGYVGAVLVPGLLDKGYRVRVLDLYIFGEHVLDGVKDHPKLKQVKGDIRDQDLLRKVLHGCDAVIHLACISNDPSVELDPALSISINYESFEPLIQLCKENGVKRFIFASSGSVYGISDKDNVTENHPLVPVSYYNKYKALCESVLCKYESPDFTAVMIRPGTICGYSPRQRLDLTVNIMTNHAVNSGYITVFGGKQIRPHIHIQDMVDLYIMLLEVPDEKIAGKTYNAGCENYTIAKTAEIVRDVVQNEMPEREKVKIVTTPSDDPRTYRASFEKIKRELGFVPKCTIKDGVRDLIKAFREGKLPNPMTDIHYYNVKLMKNIKLK